MVFRKSKRTMAAVVAVSMVLSLFFSSRSMQNVLWASDDAGMVSEVSSAEGTTDIPATEENRAEAVLPEVGETEVAEHPETEAAGEAAAEAVVAESAVIVDEVLQPTAETDSSITPVIVPTISEEVTAEADIGASDGPTVPNHIEPTNPDHLEAPIETPYVAPIDYYSYPVTSMEPTPVAYMSTRAALSTFAMFAPTAAAAPVIGVDHPTQPGEVLLYKEAKPIPGKVNTWEVTLRIEGMDKNTTSDIVLVMDTSGSMADNNRLDKAKAAATAFIEKLLPSENTRIGIVEYASEVEILQGLTNQAGTLIDTVTNLVANGGTFTQAGIKQAAAMLTNSDADNKHIVLLSDGEPTFSYELNNPDLYLVDAAEYGRMTGTQAPAEAYLNTRIGAGNSMYYAYEQPTFWGGEYKYYNHGNSAIAEAGFAKAADDMVWTIALEAGPVGDPVLKDMASEGKSFTANPNELEAIFSEIAGQISCAAKDCSSNDPMGAGFHISSGAVENIKTTQGTYSYAAEKLNWEPGTLTLPLAENENIKYAELKYTIEINNSILDEKTDSNEEYPANGDAVLTYVNMNGETVTEAFPVPTVNPVLYTVEKVLQDKDGHVIQADRSFTVRVSGPDGDGKAIDRIFDLNTKDGAKTALLTDLRNAATYRFEETETSVGSLGDYETTYFINGVETTQNEFAVVDGNTKDVQFRVINKEKAGSLTLTKVLNQDVVTADAFPVARTSVFRALAAPNAEPFEFTVTGPNTFSQTIRLPENGSWTKTLENLAWGTYTVTENGADTYNTQFVVGDVQGQGKTANVDLAFGAANQNITFTNSQKANMEVTATKHWVNGPEKRPEIYFQLIQEDSAGTQVSVGAPKLVENDSVTWNQSEGGLEKTLLRLDEQGVPYIYKVKEVNLSGEDYVPEGYEKTEDGLQVTNTYTKKTSLDVRKVWEDGENQDGIRPDEIAVSLLADGVASGRTLTLNEANAWQGTFGDLEEYKDGVKIQYSVSEVSVPQEYTSVISGDMDSGYTIANTHTPATVEVSGSKTWEDANNQDGKRPDHITIRLLADGQERQSSVVTEAENWTWSFTDLPKFRNQGVEILYSITEDAVKEYTTEYDAYNVTNKHTLGKVSLTVTKAWEDADNQDGIRPEEVTIVLMADGVRTDKTRKLNQTGHWVGSFTDLDEFKEGRRIAYTVDEPTLPEGYIAQVSGDADQGFVVKNSHVASQIRIFVSKVWDDADDKDGIRPSEVVVQLLADGKITGKKLTLNKENAWKASFDALDEYAAGKKIAYTLEEASVEGYTSSISGDALHGFTITNSHSPKVEVPRTGEGDIMKMVGTIGLLAGAVFVLRIKTKEKEL